MYEMFKDRQDYNYEDAWEAISEQIYPLCEDCRLMLAYGASLTISKSRLKKLRNAIDKHIQNPNYEPQITWEPEEKHIQGSCVSVSEQC